MDKKHEKSMLDLQRLLKTQDFKNLDEMKAFINEHVVGQSIPEFEGEALTPEELAQNYVYQATEEEDEQEADRLIFKAFLHDPDCVEAYEYLADVCGSLMAALLLYKNGYTAARKKLGEKYFEENRGHFWGLHETRPFMRCMQKYGQTLYELHQKEAALEIYFDMLSLNPNDNQGVRDLATTICLELNKITEYENLRQQFDEDWTIFHLYNYALYLFLKEGDTEASRQALTKAKQYNKHVVHLMNQRKELPPLDEMYTLGAKSEAVYYCTIAKPIWQDKLGALNWLVNSYYKP
jgi:tetratricopeptide (TPR) repeat protein